MATKRSAASIKAALSNVDLHAKHNLQEMQSILEAVYPELDGSAFQEMFKKLDASDEAKISFGDFIEYLFADEDSFRQERFWTWILDCQSDEESRLFPTGMDHRILRQNSLTKRWTLYIANKSVGPTKPRTYEKAPRANQRALEQPAFDKSGRCPFCPGKEGKLTPAELCRILPSGELQQYPKYPDQEQIGQDWLARAVRNKFPYLASAPGMYEAPFPDEGPGALKGELDNSWTNSHPDSEIYPQVDGFGASEVIIESPLHNAQLAITAGKQVAHAFRLLVSRGKELRKHDSVKQLVFFKQYGVTGGGSLVHPHMQVHTLPIVSGYMESKLRQHRDFFDRHGCCAVERLFVNDVLDKKCGATARLVRETDHFVASVPYAAVAKGRMVIAPKRHVQHFEDSTDEELFDLGPLLQLIMSAIYRVFDDPDYNVFWETLPSARAFMELPESERDAIHQNFRWTLHVRPARNRIGITNASGIDVTDTLPEIMAKRYRDAIEEELESPFREHTRKTELDQLKELLEVKEKETEDLRKKITAMESS